MTTHLEARGGARWMSLALPLGALAALAMVGLGLLRAPAANRAGAAAASVVLLIYTACGWLLPPRVARRSPELLRAALIAGLIASAIFVAEILAEYALLPSDNTPFGLAEFGLVFLTYAAVGAWHTARGGRLRGSPLAAALAAAVSALAWCLAIWAVFHLFAGSARQEAVFRAEGDLEDFRRSGMRDLRAFMTEDTVGATFFHLLLGPLLAAALGTAGGLAGLAWRWARGRAARREG